MIEKLKMQTPDMMDTNIEKIAKLFPNVITETRDENGNIKKAIDFDLLKQSLSDVLVDDENERYRLDWPGKKASMLEANTPITKTLRPCREESVNFDTTENLYIEGDNFEVLKVLQESYLGKIKMIYIDPPYNTGKDFIYKDTFKASKVEYEEKIGAVDENGDKLFKNTDSNGRFHSDWLSMMYERLVVARDLLKDEGVIFISIDDNEVHNLRKICDEVFGEEHFINLISVKAKDSSGASGGGEDKKLKKNIEYLLCYMKTVKFESFHNIYVEQNLINYIEERKLNNKGFAYTKVMINDGKEVFIKKTKAGNGEDIEIYKVLDYEIKSIHQVCKEESISLAEGYNKYYDKIFTTENAQTSIRERVKTAMPDHSGIINTYYKPISGRNKGVRTKVSFEGTTKRLVSYLSNVSEKKEGKIIKKDKIGTLWNDLSWSSVSNEGSLPYSNGKKPIALILRMLELMKFNSNDLVFDYFSGSASTAHAVMLFNNTHALNLNFLMVQLPEKIAPNTKENKKYLKYLESENIKPVVSEIGKERIRRAGKKIQEENKTKEGIEKLDIGFRVYKTDTTNMKDVYYHPDKLGQKELSDVISNIKEDRTPEDILTQVILDLGLELNLPIEKKEILDNTVFIVQTNALVACFDNNINFKIIDEIAKVKPFKVVFKDAGFSKDKDRINLEERFKRLSPATKITVI